MYARLSLLGSLVVVLTLFLADLNVVYAQDMYCQEELSQANALYTTGRFDEAIERVDACLAKEVLSDAERRTAYRLKGLCFIGKGVEVDAKASVRRLMELFPNYQPDPVQDPPDFVAMVNEMREEINRDLAAREAENDGVTEEGETDAEQQPVTQPAEETVAQVAKRKKKGSGRFILIGAGVAAAAGGAYVLLSNGGGDGGGGGGGGGVIIADPPPLPN